MKLYVTPYVIPVLYTIIPKRRNPVIVAKTEERIAFEVEIKKIGSNELHLIFENVSNVEPLRSFVTEFLKGLGEKGLKIVVNVKKVFKSFKISTYAILSAHLMKILGEELGYEISLNDIEKYAPLLEDQKLINYLPLIMALRIAALNNKSLVYRLGEGWVNLPSKNSVEIYMINMANGVRSRETIGDIDLLAHVEGVNVLRAVQSIRSKGSLERHVIMEEALQYIIYNIEEIIDLNMYFKCKCLIFPDVSGSSLICFRKPYSIEAYEKAHMLLGDNE
ncbi:MAG: hypothetical protein DRO08_01575 [Thermoprotei archaeon]|nr:MAG: hypothetical protein DRO08_01575 [Thermoprotei archaeon]